MLRLRMLLVVVVALALTAPAAARAASVAYIENGNVWLSSPDGTKKVQLTTDGTVDKPWLGVAQSANGRTVAVYHGDKVNANPRLERMKVWDALGNEVADTLLGSAPTQNFASRPTAFEISDDGGWTADEFSYCTGSGLTYCQSIARGSWLSIPATPNVTDAVSLSSFRQPTFFGRRIVSSDGATIRVQDATGTIPGSPTVYDAPLVTGAADWIPPYAAGQYNMRADVPASGGKVAVEVLVPSGTPRNFVIAMPFSGAIGTSPPDEPNGCAFGAPSVAGNAHSVAWSPDGSMIAWRDDQGLKVAGAPALPWASTDPCSFTSPPVVISPPPAKPDGKDSTGVYLTTQGPSFGGADVAAILAARAATPPAGGGGATATPGPAGGAGAPAATPPTKPTAAALVKGLTLAVTSAGSGPITATATIPAKLARRLGLPRTVATGRVSAKQAGQKLKLKLKLVKKARSKARRLKGVTVTVVLVQNGKRSTLRLKLR